MRAIVTRRAAVSGSEGAGVLPRLVTARTVSTKLRHEVA